jgi:murein DD-endopeptidase MepM/ murein hydrolase activator NlpD
MPKTAAELAEEKRLADEAEAKRVADANKDIAKPGEGLGKLLEGILGIIVQLFGGIFGGLDKGINDDSNDALSKDKAFSNGMKIGNLRISDAAVDKWKSYLATNKGESVTIQSPVEGDTHIGSGFGHRDTGIAGASHNHKGIDMGARGSDAIVAAAQGIVICSGKYGTAGNTVIIGHPDGRFTTYMHLRDNCGMPAVGAEVAQGQKIAIMGNTSSLKTPLAKHLHFQLHNESGKEIHPEIAGMKIRKGQHVEGAHSAEAANDYASIANREAHPKLPFSGASETTVPGGGKSRQNNHAHG